MTITSPIEDGGATTMPQRQGGAVTTRHAGIDPVYALLADGSTVQIRQVCPDDYDGIKAMHEAMSRDNSYLRFFHLSRLSAAQEAHRLCRLAGTDHTALLARRGDEVVGVGSYELVAPGDAAEIAFAVADHMHGHGVGTLLLEHLVALAREQGVREFVGETLIENTAMLQVLTDAGLPVQRHVADGIVEWRFPLPDSDAGEVGRQLERYLAAVARREAQADVASLLPLLRPASVAVVGASRRTGTVGRAILRNIVTGGYRGRVYAVNPHTAHLEGVPCLPSVTALTEPVDLAVLAVPPAVVPQVATECGRRGVRALVVVTSGLDDAQGADLLAACRRHGMRLVGPNCFGVAVPALGLDATFAARHPSPGVVGVVAQSGGLGIALADQLSRLGLGVSTFASVGNKYDVSGNDMLEWFDQDQATRLAVLYLESFGNPRKFAGTARRVARRTPVLIVDAGRSAAGQRAAASHTAAAATPSVTRRALFDQAGMIVTDGLGELVDVAALLATQPVPGGRDVAIVSNVGGAGVLAADACGDHGLTVHTTGGAARRKLRTLLPAGAALTGPVDTTAAVGADQFRRCLDILAADGPDAVLALVLPTATTGDLLVAARGADVGVPLVAVELDQAEGVRLLSRDGPTTETGSGNTVPVYADPRPAVCALAHAAGYGAWRARPVADVPELPDVAVEEARNLIGQFLDDDGADGGWLSQDRVTALLACYGIAATPLLPAEDEQAAVRAAAAVDGPVALKAEVPGVVHKTDAGAVRLDLHTETEVREEYRSLRAAFGGRLRRVLVQPMITGGTEVLIGVTQEPVFGPLVVFGTGGVATDVAADHAARLCPLTGAEADELIAATRVSSLLRGHRGAPPADPATLRDLLLRVSRLADDLPQVAELDLNPVLARPDGVAVIDARIRLTPVRPHDPFLRRLR